MSRKQFIESVGATCKNWQNAWSFINVDEKVIIFGAWKHLVDDHGHLILSRNWMYGKKGRKRAGFTFSKEHIRLIEEEGYSLKTFPMKLSSSPTKDRINTFEPFLSDRNLLKIGDNWYAV